MTLTELIKIGFNHKQYKVMLYCILKRDSDGVFTFGKEQVKELQELTNLSPKTIRRNFNSILEVFFIKLSKTTYQFAENDTVS